MIKIICSTQEEKETIFACLVDSGTCPIEESVETRMFCDPHFCEECIENKIEFIIDKQNKE